MTVDKVRQESDLLLLQNIATFHRRKAMSRAAISRLRELQPGKNWHLCWEWDGLALCVDDPEYKSCKCAENAE